MCVDDDALFSEMWPPPIFPFYSYASYAVLRSHPAHSQDRHHIYVIMSNG